MNKYTKDEFTEIIKQSGVNLSGLVLDLCSGYISIASVYDYKKVVCYDFLTRTVEELSKRNIKVVQGDMRDIIKFYLPFKDNSIDYLFCSGLPTRSCRDKDNSKACDLEISVKKFMSKIASEIIRVTKEKAVINSLPFVKLFPEKYNSRIEKLDEEGFLVVLKCED